MPITSPISNTITDATGAPIVGVPVEARLQPSGCFRIDDGSEIASTGTTTNATGTWTLNLEQQSNIAPAGTYYIVEEDVPDSAGGPRQWKISVGATPATLQQARIP